MGLVRFSSALPFELQDSSCTDTTLAPPPPPSEPPHSFSYLLSMQDMIRLSPDSAARPSVSDHGIEYSQLVSSPCSATEQDHRLVETISEDDRATLLPIIRIAFPSLKYSMQDPYSAWHSAGDDRVMGKMEGVRQGNEVEGLRYHSMPMEGFKQDNEEEGLHYRFLPTGPSRMSEVHHAAGGVGDRSQEGLRDWSVGEGEGRIMEIEERESFTKAQDLMSLQGTEPVASATTDLMSLQRKEPVASTLTDDKLSLSMASGCAGLNLFTNFGIALNSCPEDRAARNPCVQPRIAPYVEESSELVHERQFISGPSSIESGSLRLDSRSSNYSKAVDQSHAILTVEASHGENGTGSGQIVTSEPEEGASIGMGSDLASGCSGPENQEESHRVTECQDLNPAVDASPNADQFKFPEIIRKRRNVIKKAVGWVRKRRTTQSSSARVSHKRKCGSACCTGCELGPKRRKTSGYSSRGTTRSTQFSLPSEFKSTSSMKKIPKEQLNTIRKLSIAMALNTGCPALNASHVQKGLFQSLQEWGKAPLSSALYLLVLESGGQGMTVCEALRKLLKKGYYKLFIPNSHPRAVQVKMALRRCPDFKELDNRRFVLRNNRKADDKKQNLKAVAKERSRGGAEGNGVEEVTVMKGSCQKPWLSGACSERLTQASVAGYTGEFACQLHGGKEHKIEQCRKTDGKQWRCSQQAKLGFLYCEHHHQGRNKSRVKGNSQGKISAINSPGQISQVLCTEEWSETVADSCSGQSRGHSQEGEEPKMDQCRRTDGRHWRCSKQAQPGSIYCEHHQGRRKKGKAKGNGHGLSSVVKGAKQELQVLEAFAVDRSQTALNGCKGKAKGNEHGQITPVREAKQEKGNGHGQITTVREAKQEKGNGHGQITGVREAKEDTGNVHGQITAAREAKQELQESEACAVARSQTTVNGGKGKTKCNRHGQITVVREAKQELQVSEACAVDRSQTAVNGWKGKAEGNGHGRITVARETKQELQVSEAYAVVRSQTAVNGCCPGENNGHFQGNDEQQLERCHRRDGKRWQCSRQCKPGFIYCEHHQGRRYKGRAVGNGQSKFVIRKELDKPVPGTCLEGFSQTDGNGCSLSNRGHLNGGEQQHVEMSHMTEDCSQSAAGGCSEFLEGYDQLLKRCHRTDGKGWQCSRQAKQGFNYCEHHQLYLSKRTTHSKGFRKGAENDSSSSNPSKSWSDMLTMGCSSGSEMTKSTPVCMQHVVL